MNITKLQTAIMEAERFLLRAKTCMSEDSLSRMDSSVARSRFDIGGSHSAITAVKRSSMDLSAALISLRGVRRKKQ